MEGEIFYTLREAQIIIESWRQHYNAVSAPCLARLQTTSTGGLRARIRVAGFAYVDRLRQPRWRNRRL